MLCSKICIVSGDNLKTGNTKSCGCLKTNIENLSGNQFGYWNVLNQYKKENGKIFWLCECKCGTKKYVRADILKNKTSQSCGCLKISKNSLLIEKILIENNIKFKKEYCFPELKSPKNKPLRFDFVIFNNLNQIDRIIEYDGEQHFNGGFNMSEDDLKYLQHCDKIKNDYCKKNNYKLIRISYTNKKISLNTIFS